MKNMLKNNILALVAVAVLHLPFCASAITPDATGCVPGRWTKDLAAAKALAKKNNVFYVIDCAKSEGCAYCTASEGAYVGPFQDWSRENGIPLVYGDYVYLNSDPAAKAAWSYRAGYSGWPFVTLVSPDDGTTMICKSMIRSGLIVNESGFTAEGASYPLNGYWYEANTPAEWLNLFHFLLNRTDDKPASAVRIEPDDSKVAQPTEHGLYRAYGVNDLNYAVKKNGNINWSKAEDVADWFVFSNVEAGKSYKLSGTYEESEPDIGRIFIYDSLVKANAGAASIEAAEANCCAQGLMNEFTKGGFAFTADKAGDYYIEFTRRSVAPIKGADVAESITIKYTFNFQEGVAQKYGFSAPSDVVKRGMSVMEVRLSRASDKGQESIPYVLYGFGEGSTNATAIRASAELYGDFNYPQPDGDHVFLFRDGETLSDPVKIPIFDPIYTEDNCFFYVKAIVDPELLDHEGGDWLKVNIEDDGIYFPIGDDDPAKATVLNHPYFSTNGAYCATSRLSTTDKADWFKLTNVAPDKVYSVYLGTTNMWEGVDEVTLQLYGPGSDNKVEGKSVTVAKAESDRIDFVPMCPTNYFIRISAKRTSGAAFSMVYYGVTLVEQPRPVLEFTQGSAAYDSPTADRVEAFTVTNLESALDFGYEVNWAALDVSAEKDLDYAADDSGPIIFAEGSVTGAVDVTLLDCTNGWRDLRSFKLQLRPGEFYTLGDVTNLTVTLRADPSGNPEGSTPDDPKKIAITAGSGTTTWLKAGLRNVSGVTEDWIEVSGLKASSSYALTATDVRIKPESATGKVKVSVLTNGVVMAETECPLAELADALKIVDFGALPDGKAMIRVVQDPPDASILATYDLGIREWQKPTLAFETAAMETDDTNDTVSVALVRTTAYKDVETRVRVFTEDGTAIAETDYQPFDEVLTFTNGQDRLTIDLSLIADLAYVWKGDRAFRVKFELQEDEDPAAYTLAEPSETVVTIKETVEELDGYDPGDDIESGAVETALFDGVPSAATGGGFTDRRLNGSDLSDWFKFPNALAGVSYRFRVYFESNKNVIDDEVMLVVRMPDGAAYTNSFDSIITNNSLWDTPAVGAGGGTLYAQVFRKAPAEDVPVSCAYGIVAYAWPWPKMSFEKETDEVARDVEPQAYPFTVVRSDNLMENDPGVVNHVRVWLEGDSGLFGFEERTIDFLPGVASTNLSVELACATDIWTGDRSFKLCLAVEEDAEKEKIRPGAYTNLTVTVRDETPQYDPADRTDATAVGATNLTDMCATWQSVVAHLNGREGANTDPEIGDDGVDWYEFSGLTLDKMYRFEIRGAKYAGVRPEDVTVEFFYDPQGAAFVRTTFAAMAEDGYKTPKVTQDKVYVKISRLAAGKELSYVKYELWYKMQANRKVRFAKSADERPETAAGIWVDVICETEGEEIDLSPVTVDVIAETIPEGECANPAVSPEHFIAGKVETLTWGIGLTGGTTRVKVPFTNYEEGWVGDRTFRLSIEPDSDTELGSPKTMTVTMLETSEPEHGVLALACDDLSVTEGEEFTVWVTRSGGKAGDISADWVWSDGSKATTPLFAEFETGEKAVNLTVPTTAGFQPSQTFTLRMEPKGGAAVKPGTSDTLTFTVRDRDFAGKVSAYSDGDKGKVPFRAAGTSWHLDANGALTCSTPAANTETVLSATVKGPGTLVFDVTLTDAANCTLKGRVTGETDVRLTAGEDRELVIGVGSRTVQFAFARGAQAADTASASISNVRFVPDEETFRTLGTFTGPVSVGYDEPGFCTLTVATSGRISGKIQLPGRTLTFSGEGGWDGDSIVVDAKVGDETWSVTFTVDAAMGRVDVRAAEESLVGELGRDNWSDVPLIDENAVILAKAAGYYTLTLPRSASDSDKYGSGYLGLTVGEDGSAKASGVLADGQPVSMSGSLMTIPSDSDPGSALLYLFARPSAYNSGWFALPLAFVRSREGVPTALKKAGFGVLSGVPTWCGGLAFYRFPGVSGGWYDKWENLAWHYENGLSVSNVTEVGKLDGESAKRFGGSAACPVALSFNEDGSRIIANDDLMGLFTMNFVRATGIFSGNLRAVYEISGDEKVKSAPYRGMLTPVRATSDRTAGRGFFLMEDQGVRASYDFTIEE